MALGSSYLSSALSLLDLWAEVINLHYKRHLSLKLAAQDTEHRPASLLSLPQETLVNTMEFLDWDDVLRLRQVSHRMKLQVRALICPVLSRLMQCVDGPIYLAGVAPTVL
jgi:hypothetical protein